jgi:hypothetical protein
MPYCTECGVKMSERARFCRACGTPAEVGETSGFAAPVGGGAAPEGAAVPPTGGPPAPPPAPRPRRPIDVPLVTVVAIAAVAVVALVVAVLLIVRDVGGGDGDGSSAPIVQPTVQNERVNSSHVKEGIHSLQIGIQSYAVDHDDTYPDRADQATIGYAIDVWPTNPWTGEPMHEGTDPGDYAYSRLDGGTSFELVGYGAGGMVVIAVP